jgi:hypothetical protein
LVLPKLNLIPQSRTAPCRCLFHKLLLASSSSEIEKRTGFYQQWYRSAGFHGEGDVHYAINHGLQQYRSDRSPHEAGVRRKIADAVIEVFTSRNAKVERWPVKTELG